MGTLSLVCFDSKVDSRTTYVLERQIYPQINNGVYRSGFASEVKPYTEAVTQLFEGLDRLEKILSDGREFIVGGQLTEVDVRTYTTIARFDIVYHGQ